MKQDLGFIIAFVLITAGLLFIISVCGGCSILQPRANPGDALTNLPTTGTEAMFQTLKKANWLYTLSIIGVGAGFFAFLNGSSKGIQVMASCLVVLSLIIGMTKYSAVIAAIAMIGAVCLMIYSTLIKGKALREVIGGVQKIRETVIARRTHKENGLTDTTEQVPIKDLIDVRLGNTQSKTTKAIVKAVKEKL